MLGIIAEYNPFHNGHLYHINKAKNISKEEKCIVVMGGNFLQRGEPAILDKFLRAKMCLLNGVDLVLELPIHFSTSSAEMFSLGAIDLLDKTGIVNKVCFGSENCDLDLFFDISKILISEPFEFKKALENEVSKGLSFPKARQIALEKILDKNLDFLSMPNNILALEYIKAIIKLNSNIKPFTIKREIAGFHSKDIKSEISSATAIRNAIIKNDFEIIQNCMPKNCYDIIIENKNNIHNIDDYSTILNYLLKTKSIEEIKNILEIREGIENKLIKNSDTILISQLIEKVKSKRYTKTNIQRMIMNIILEKTKEENEYYKKNLNQYIRVLGFKKSSIDIISEISKKAKVPLIINLKDYKKILDENAKKTIEKNIKCTDIYNISKSKIKNYEISQKVVII